MFVITRKQIRAYEKGLVFKNRELVKILDKGAYWFFDPFNQIKLQIVSVRDTWFEHKDLDLIVKSKKLGDDAVIIDLKDFQRALIWIDGRFDRVIGPGLYVLWNRFADVNFEIIDARNVLFEHDQKVAIQKSASAQTHFNISFVSEGFVGVLYVDGQYVDTFGPGQYMFWQNSGKVKFYHVDMRQIVMDVSGQEIMTADKVTLRMNAVVTYQVVDAKKSIVAVEDSKQAIYREAQLALRAAIGTFELDTLLNEKDQLVTDLEKMLRIPALKLGMEVVVVGIRDIILPGEMKQLMNKVMEAKKAADANLIMRREETAAMRSQANTARILENNPTLMRLRELDVLEKIASSTKLNVVLGEKGLADKIVNLL